jgi:catechol 2,3-dioxygenase-like lactoylglutathione lyase family enzyme
MAKILHSMIRVIDENKSVAFYKKAFGLDVAQRFPFDGSRSSTCETRKTTSSWSSP